MSERNRPTSRDTSASWSESTCRSFVVIAGNAGSSLSPQSRKGVSASQLHTTDDIFIYTAIGARRLRGYRVGDRPMGGNMTGMPLILASASPRRAELLANAGIAFVIRPAHVPEIHNHAESPADYVRRLARAKAAAVEATEDEVVLGADTTVVAAGEVLEKPADAADRSEERRVGKECRSRWSP